MGFKYVMLEIDNGAFKRRLPIIFPDILVHADVAAAIQQIQGMAEAKPVSAGSIDLFAEACHGKSTTLNVASNWEGDAKLINTFPYFHGIEA